MPEPAELPLDSAARTVELPRPLRLARDQEIGRIVFILVGLGRGHQLTRNLQRVVAWTLLSSVL